MTQYQRFELSRIDGEISELEKKIAVKHEQRRELEKLIRMSTEDWQRKSIYVFVQHGKDELPTNVCPHKNSTCVDVTAMSDDKTKLACLCDDCGCQLPWQHEDLKP